MAYYSPLIVHLWALHDGGAQKNMDANDSRLVLVWHLMGFICNLRTGVCIHIEHDRPLNKDCCCASNHANRQHSECRFYGEFTYSLTAPWHWPVTVAKLFMNTVINERTWFIYFLFKCDLQIFIDTTQIKQKTPQKTKPDSVFEALSHHIMVKTSSDQDPSALLKKSVAQ